MRIKERRQNLRAKVDGWIMLCHSSQLKGVTPADNDLRGDQTTIKIRFDAAYRQVILLTETLDGTARIPRGTASSRSADRRSKVSPRSTQTSRLLRYRNISSICCTTIDRSLTLVAFPASQFSGNNIIFTGPVYVKPALPAPDANTTTCRGDFEQRFYSSLSLSIRSLRCDRS